MRRIVAFGCAAWGVACAPPCEPESSEDPRDFALDAAERADLEATALGEDGAFSCAVACADTIGVPEGEIAACALEPDGDAGTLHCEVAVTTYCE